MRSAAPRAATHETIGQRFTHVAVTVPRECFEDEARSELLGFYAEVFGWRENPDLSIPGERIFLCAPSNAQYLTIRASSAPMSTSGYEHLGLALDSESALRAIHARAAALGGRFRGLELGPIRSEYGGRLLTFRLRFRLPLTIEVQHLGSPAR
jgi:hypothetical protein